MIAEHVAAIISRLEALGMTVIDTQVGPGGQSPPYVLVWGPLNPHSDVVVSGADVILDTYVGVTAVGHSVAAVRSLLSRAYAELHGSPLAVAGRSATLMHRETRLLETSEATSLSAVTPTPMSGVDIYDLHSVPA